MYFRNNINVTVKKDVCNIFWLDYNIECQKASSLGCIKCEMKKLMSLQLV